MTKAKTVYIAMSGGVDSSVTAALVKQQGYKPVGAYMKNWTADVLGFVCPWREDLTDAQSVAAKLQIPFKVFDFEKQYKQKVVDYMVAGFKAGETPNPDIVCNQEIKFKLFLDAALEDGADLIATGHYARVKKSQLYAATDKLKDQSYFLYRVSKEALGKTLMPIGEYKKSQVRQLAQRFGLPTAAKPDSMGICFVGQVDIKDFLRQYIKTKPGSVILMRTGEEVGEHAGAIFYTIGQRHGLGIGGGKPLYVISKDIKKNIVYVSDDPGELELYSDQVSIMNPHWIDGVPKPNKTYQVRLRHTGKLTNCHLSRVPPRKGLKKGKPADDSRYQIKLVKPERAITPGQSAVIYDKSHVLGGGIITLAGPINS